jgi:phospholipid transport system substrate-binding protein
VRAWPTLALTLVLSLALVRVAAAQEDARAYIQATVDDALVVLKNKSLPTEEKLHRLEDIAYARFDFETMARLVLARNWTKLTPDQQKQFIQEFKRHLSVTYGKNIESYRNEAIEITSDRPEARGDWTVKTKIVRGSEDFQVDYRLRKNASGQWKIIDVVIEHVSLIANFRAQLQDVISSKGPEEMLRLLHEKNVAGQSILPNDGKVQRGAGSE